VASPVDCHGWEQRAIVVSKFVMIELFASNFDASLIDRGGVKIAKARPPPSCELGGTFHSILG